MEKEVRNMERELYECEVKWIDLSVLLVSENQNGIKRQGRNSSEKLEIAVRNKERNYTYIYC